VDNAGHGAKVERSDERSMSVAQPV
jgi:hypothetical protein